MKRQNIILGVVLVACIIGAGAYKASAPTEVVEITSIEKAKLHLESKGLHCAVLDGQLLASINHLPDGSKEQNAFRVSAFHNNLTGGFVVVAAKSEGENFLYQSTATKVGFLYAIGDKDTIEKVVR